MSHPSDRSLAGEQPPLQRVRDFWETHVNNEYYTRECRATSAYFDQIEHRRYRLHHHLRELFSTLDGTGKRLLEVGCGMGVDSIELSRAGFNVTAIDLTASAIDIARKYARMRQQDIDFRVGNVEKLEFADCTFDVVYAFGVLHHTPDIGSAVREIFRVLRPNGTAHVMLYHRNSLVNLIHWIFRLPYESPRNLKDRCPVVYTFSRRAARELFSSFEIVEIHADYPFSYGFRYLTFWIPRAVQRIVGRLIGWHLMVRAVK